ncbi:RNA methyltransferase [Candidatus Epulonipiscioides saccharophilum]|nr:RNA methyltransferase [Epulopiscium sp. SCG-B10WGA-EpuloB]
MKNLLLEEYDRYIKSFSRPIYRGIRINTNKVSLENWERINPFKNLKNIPWCAEAKYYFDDRPAKHPYYQAGLYYIQEPSAMAVVALLPINSGDSVLDMCAAPGGKSTHALAKLNGTGLLVANDISFSRARILEKNLETFGAKNTMIISEDPKKLLALWKAYFDKIIIDAPCSGEGMFKKDEKAIKSWQDLDRSYFCEQQKSLLNTAAQLLKPGGMIVYSTCTFSPEENEDRIEEFLAEHNEFEIVNIPLNFGLCSGRLNGSIRLWPHKVDAEGHFVCLLQKKVNSIVDVKPLKNNQTKKLKDYPILKNFFEAHTHMNLNQLILEHNGKFYAVNDNFPPTLKIRTLQSGLFLGELKNKKSFIPSHALAMAYSKDFFKHVISFSSKTNLIEVEKYLKGETLFSDVMNGYHIFCVDDYPLGWVKALNGVLKNKYPPSRM